VEWITLKKHFIRGFTLQGTVIKTTEPIIEISSVAGIDFTDCLPDKDELLRRLF